MMQSLNNEWLLLFASTKYVIRINTTPVSIVCNDNIFFLSMISYSTLTMTTYFSITFLMFLKFLPNIACRLK